MNVKLLHITPIEIAVLAIRQCYDSFENSDSYNEVFKDFTTTGNTLKSIRSEWNPKFILGPKDKALIERVIESGHTSTLEHINVTFKLEGFTRDVLQELSRHRHASPSVKSTRYTLRELKAEESFFSKDGMVRAPKYVELTGNGILDTAIINSLEAIRICINDGLSNDQVKSALPESYFVDSIFTINIRSLRNFLELRTSHRAYFKIRDMAFKMYYAIPDDYKFMLSDCIEGEKSGLNNI